MGFVCEVFLYSSKEMARMRHGQRRRRRFAPGTFQKENMHASSLIHFFDFVLRRVVQEIRRDEQIGNPIVFYFEHGKLPGLFLQVESRDDLVDIKDTYPSSFHLVKMVRRGEKLIEEVVSIP